jgi:hypothetical protein
VFTVEHKHLQRNEWNKIDWQLKNFMLGDGKKDKQTDRCSYGDVFQSLGGQLQKMESWR